MEFGFSVVMALYNAEKDLREAIDSIINQSFGFERIQLILVNDGSTDCTLNICKSYRDSYPENVFIIDKENGGVSSARNAGKALASGRYTIFFDGDDLWDADAFQRIYMFFEEHRSEVDVCCCRLKHIGDFEKLEHPLDYKFKKGDRVVDLTKKPILVQSTIGNAIFKTEIIKDIEFDSKLVAGEDAVFNSMAVLKRLKLGIISSAVFFYRRNRFDASLSSRSTFRKSWYTNVPKRYYLALIEYSRSVFGEVIPYIQNVILYDIRWRNYSVKMESILSQEEMDIYRDLMYQTVCALDDIRIIKAKGINQYKKLSMLNLKYGKNILEDSVLGDDGFYTFNGQRVFNLRGNSVLRIGSVEVSEDNKIHIEGFFNDFGLTENDAFQMFSDTNEAYPVTLKSAPKHNLLDFFGNTIAKAYYAMVTVPVRNKKKYRFVINTSNKDTSLNPSFTDDILLTRDVENSFIIRSDYILKYKKCNLEVYRNTFYTRFASNKTLEKELDQKKNKEKIKKYHERFSQNREIEKLKLKNQVCFFTPRSNTELQDNIKQVYDKCDPPKIALTKMAPFLKEDLSELGRGIFSSKVVVTDDYTYMFRRFQKKKGQRYVQLWHAAGAFKKFGLDVNENLPSIEKKYHSDYDLVCVSSEYVRSTYADAFGISKNVVQALGVPRTDDFYNDALSKEIVKKVYDSYPEFRGKKVILYAPTFRNAPGQLKTEFVPKLDFDTLSKSLPDDCVFAICPHPVMKVKILPDHYNNLFEIRDIPTHEMIRAADLLVTDYSSVIFDYSLLNKPMVFFCYDYEDYNRDFYLDYETDLPGEIFKNQEEFINYLASGDFRKSEKLAAFREKYMGACDGHSTERIIKAIKSF